MKLARLTVKILLTFAIFVNFTALPIWAQEKTDPNKPVIIVSPFTHEALFVKFPPGWSIKNEFRKGDECVMQLLPPGETPETLTRMVTINTILGLQTKANALQVMEQTFKVMEQNKGKARLDLKTISKDKTNDVMFEYSLVYPLDDESLYPSQYEMQRIISGADGVRTIIYHVKDPNVSAKDHQQILEFMRWIHLQSLPIKTK